MLILDDANSRTHTPIRPTCILHLPVLHYEQIEYYSVGRIVRVSAIPPSNVAHDDTRTADTLGEFATPIMVRRICDRNIPDEAQYAARAFSSQINSGRKGEIQYIISYRRGRILGNFIQVFPFSP